MTKIYLLNAPCTKRSGETSLTYPPLGILYIAAYARKQIGNIQIRVVDGYQKGLRGCIDDINRYHPDILGVSFTTQAANGAYAVINEVKREDLLVISGGAHPTAMPNDVLTKSRTDVVVLGEGELTFVELMRGYIESNNIPKNTKGTAQKEGDSMILNPPRPQVYNLNTIPFPARDLTDIKNYPGFHLKKRKRDTNIMFARGCPYKCTFCANSVWRYTKPCFRLRSPSNIVDEMEHVIEHYGIREFYDFSDTFNVSIKWAKQVCDEIIGRDLDLSWKTQLRVDNVDNELAEKMAEAGCWLACIGIESGNDDTLKGIKKGITIGQVRKSLKILKEQDVKVLGFFMLFNVWEENGKLRYEDKTKSENTLRFAEELVEKGLMDFLSLSLTTPYPGSELYEIALRHGLLEDTVRTWEKWDESCNFILRLPDISERDWLSIKIRGEILQAKLVLRSGHMNLSAMPLYIRRGKGIIQRAVRRVKDETASLISQG